MTNIYIEINVNLRFKFNVNVIHDYSAQYAKLEQNCNVRSTTIVFNQSNGKLQMKMCLNQFEWTEYEL